LAASSVVHQAVFADLPPQLPCLQAIRSSTWLHLVDQVGHIELAAAQAHAQHQLIIIKQRLPGLRWAATCW
jgi:hypothetical protein